MNSKEALEILFSSYNFDGNYHDLIIAREKLEQSLDRLEQLEKERQEVEAWLSSKETNTFDEIATMIKKANDYDVLIVKYNKLEKALDILISKKVDVNHLKRTKDFNGYNRIRQFYNADYLTEEEYELLKEVLDCD